MSKKQGNQKNNRNSESSFRKEEQRQPKKRLPQEKKKPIRNYSEKRTKRTNTSDAESIRLNKFIANAGVCSRRDADTLIVSGAIAINGTTVTTLGAKVKPGDKVTYDGHPLNNEKKVYVLLNKPKDFITTTEDPQQRRTVLSLVQNACKERIYPVGRLDRMTTGLLLLTNDGDLAKKLTHPRHRIRKMYHVTLDKALKKQDMISILEGVELDDGLVDVDKIEYVKTAQSRKEVGLELHSGKNRVIRRLFEKLGYKVLKLDRVMLAGLTKKNIERGRWRFLSDKEIGYLKMK